MANNNSIMVIIKSERENFPNTMTEFESKVMNDHFVYLKELTSQGKIVMAGPTLDDNGGYIFLNVTSAEEAKEIMRGDPSVKQGVMIPEFHPFRVSLLKC